MVTVDEEERTAWMAPLLKLRRRLTATGAQAIGCNCSAGPATVLSVISGCVLGHPSAGGDAECWNSPGRS